MDGGKKWYEHMKNLQRRVLHITVLETGTPCPTVVFQAMLLHACFKILTKPSTHIQSSASLLASKYSLQLYIILGTVLYIFIHNQYIIKFIYPI